MLVTQDKSVTSYRRDVVSPQISVEHCPPRTTQAYNQALAGLSASCISYMVTFFYRLVLLTSIIESLGLYSLKSGFPIKGWQQR
jgi:hypothetical protein